jgi:hypothetical protein
MVKIRIFALCRVADTPSDDHVVQKTVQYPAAAERGKLLSSAQRMTKTGVYGQLLRNDRLNLNWV